MYTLNRFLIDLEKMLFSSFKITLLLHIDKHSFYLNFNIHTD